MPSVPARDINMEVAGIFRDLGVAHASPHGRMAYKRAAQAVLALDEPLDALAARHSLREIPGIGPATERIIQEYLREGTSATAERAIEASAKRDEVLALRAHRSHFLSRAAVAGALRARRGKGVIALSDYKGDLQMHTEWSDGGESIASMAQAAMTRGYRYIGVSDHSYGLRIARGMSMADAAKQRREIERLNSRWDGEFRVFQGIEANIPLEGGVDMTAEEIATFDLVLAAPHSRLRRSEDQTERMLATVRHPGVHVLAHPRGRMYSRQGVLARWDEVFDEAASHDVAIELDGDPYRQDLDHSTAKRALKAGCLFALDSDAHAGRELAYSEIAVAHARLAGIPARRVINTWTADELQRWAERKRRPKAQRKKRAR